MFYDEKEALETRHANNSLDKVVSVNDLERLCHIKKRYKKVTSKKKKQDCDSEFCLIFPCDKENGFADTILCHNGCKLHKRCEGIVNFLKMKWNQRYTNAKNACKLKVIIVWQNGLKKH